MKYNSIRIILGLLSLLACAACTPNATDFLQMSGGYEPGTGSVLTPAGTLTPY